MRHEFGWGEYVSGHATLTQGRVMAANDAWAAQLLGQPLRIQ